MSEEMERTMQFILEQQAQLTVKLDKLAERVDGIAEKVDQMAEAQVKHESRTEQLEESFRLLVQLASNTDERLDMLAEAQAHTDERMSAFITTVERYISEGRNGSAQP
ncbi:hypothetical protein BH18ACI2_BH18ACI2_19440 [soil metagenome]